MGSESTGPEANTHLPGSLAGTRVVELGDFTIDYCGLTLAGLGCEVIKVEPPEGSPARSLGPYLNSTPDVNESLFFWAYNRGKTSLVLDLPTQQQQLLDLLKTADILLDATPTGISIGLGWENRTLAEECPDLIVARLSPFGDSGPWSEYRGADIVHAALGGVLMNCGYDPKPDGAYDLPPMLPHFMHSYHVAGDQLVIGIIAALYHRARTGEAQRVTCAIHEAVAKSTETDLMSWVMVRTPYLRQTARHALSHVTPNWSIAYTKDGRWMTALSIGPDRNKLRTFLAEYGIHLDASEEAKSNTEGGRPIPGLSSAMTSSIPDVQRFVRLYNYTDLPWREAQEAGLLWAPIRKPHENAEDTHWLKRATYADIEHTNHGRTFRYPVRKWLATRSSWQALEPAPNLSDRPSTSRGSTHSTQSEPMRIMNERSRPSVRVQSPHGKPFALGGVRVLDFTWFLATAGGTRFLASLGADCLKVEWKANPDSRYGPYPIGGREARDRAMAPVEPIPPDPDMGGQFNNKNPGKRGLSLNIRHPKGLTIAKDLVSVCDVVAEGFSPGVMEKWGLGYDVLRDINPHVIYAKQSGMGGIGGDYGRYRAVGPIAGALAGLTEMGGLPDPAPPSGWGYSYLDWLAAYSLAIAILSALYQREVSGQGQWIDASQCEVGLFTTALQVLEWSAHGTQWSRVGNRHPYGHAAPHGVYRCKGPDRWIAISCTTDHEWRSLAQCIQEEDLADDPSFRDHESRLKHGPVLDQLIEAWTASLDPYLAMDTLQRSGVPAGVAQTAADRCDRDPQLAHLNWLTEVTGSKIGRWPLAEVPFRLDKTPAHIGGITNRGAPCYGEDNYTILSDLLNMSDSDIEQLEAEGVI